MPFNHKYCFIIKLREATIMIGWLGFAISLGGLLTAVANITETLPPPEDPIAYSFLEIVFFLGVHGIIFHLIFIIISIVLIIGSMRDIPPLLIPWVAWTPFFILAMIVNIVVILTYDSVLVVPVLCFAAFIFIVKIYSTVIVAHQFQELIKIVTRERYYEDLGVSPGGRGFAAYYDTNRESVQVIPMSDPSAGPSSSSSATDRRITRLLHNPSMQNRLSRTYSNILKSQQPQI